MGADRVVFHPGSSAKTDRKRAFDNCKRGIYEAIDELVKEGLYPDIMICPETMGKTKPNRNFRWNFRDLWVWRKNSSHNRFWTYSCIRTRSIK